MSATRSSVDTQLPVKVPQDFFLTRCAPPSTRPGNRQPLNGSLHSYLLRFAKDQQPEAKRFWSLTAYTPDAIELIPNKADKYVVASYTPGLVTASDGSVTILMSVIKPKDFPESNWLPVSPGQFNIMLRDYGPEGTVLDGSYVPPPVIPQ